MVDRGARIGVLMGGLSAERPISLKSGAAVVEALRERGWEAVPIDVGRDLPERLIAERIDVAWLALHGRFGEDGCVQGLLEVMGIPYTGSGVRASAIAMDKASTKIAVAGLPEVVTADDVRLSRGDPIPEIPLPAVVKPCIGGSSLGMTLARTREELTAALRRAFSLDAHVLVERFVAGEEITVAVLDGEPLPVVRILPDDGFFDFEAKYVEGRTRYEVPASLPGCVAERARAAAGAVYRALGCRGAARADFIVRDDGTPVFLEINTLPGMTGTSLVPMAAREVGISFADLCERLLHGAEAMAAETGPVV